MHSSAETVSKRRSAGRLSARVFGVFMACAFLPLLLYGTLGYQRAISLLEERAFDRLRSDLSTYGNAVVDRIHVLESELARLTDHVYEGHGLGSVEASPAVGKRFTSIACVDEGEVTSLFGHALPAADVVALCGDEVGVRFVSNLCASQYALFACYRREEGGPAMVAEVDPAYLWGLDTITDGIEMAITDEGQRPLTSRQAEVPSAASGSDREVFEWTVEGEPHLATTRRLFTAPQIGMNFLITRGERRDAILAPAIDLSRLLGIIGVATLLFTALLSRRWIGHTLRPIETLRRATTQVAGGNLDVQVPVESNDEIADLGRAFNDMTGELRTARDHLVAARDAAVRTARIQGDFIQNVSHELRTPMTCVVAAAEILETTGLDDADSAGMFLAEVGEQSRKLMGLIDNVISYTEVQSERDSPPEATVDVMAGIRAAVRTCEERRRARDVTITLSGPDGLPLVRGSDYRLPELWERVLDNAIKFGPIGGEVRVSTRLVGDTIEVEVEDDGRGIRAEDREAVFEPFRQSSDDLITDKPPGTGLGLTIAREIVERHAGTIEIAAPRERGAVVRVRLPVAAPVPVRGEVREVAPT